MRISPTLPNVLDEGWYNTTDSVEAMGMERTTFWRKANAGCFRRQWRAIDGNWVYLGKSLKDVWRGLTTKHQPKRTRVIREDS